MTQATELGPIPVPSPAAGPARRRGVLRVYLGAAPGVGKTFDMLSEGHRRADRGTDVVVGFVESHGRAHTAELVEGLEVIPRRTLTYRGARFTEMDLPSVLARQPEVVLVDELAHTNVPGAGNVKRWQDVMILLDAGIEVITTVNIQHLESLNDVVEVITGVRQQETVPDSMVRGADQLELVDMSPEALRRRLAHGNVYAAEKIDAASTNFFRVGNLTALRELALLWMADRVDAALETYRADHHITDPGLMPAVVAALTAGLTLNYVIIDPIRTLTINKPANLLSLLVMVSTALAVAAVVDQAARRTKEAQRARAEADTLTVFAGSVLRGEDTLPQVLERIRVTLRLDSAGLYRRPDPSGPWQLAAAAGSAPTQPDGTGHQVGVTENTQLVLHGHDLSSSEARVLGAIAAQLATLLERVELRSQAADARIEKARSDIRAALLAAVSHDLRNPLAGIKASIETLRAPDLVLSPQDTAELLAGVDSSADQLQGLIDNLLDMSRLDAGALVLRTGPVALDEIVPRALRTVPSDRVEVDVRHTLPLVRGDTGLIERIIANLVDNAVRHASQDFRIRVTAGTIKGTVVLRVIDHGAGVPSDRLETMFRAFQRLGDVPAGQGVGLGLAVSRGFAEANGGTLEAEHTPGGGLTMVLTLPVDREPSGDDEVGTP